MIDDLLKMALQGGGNPPNMGATALQVGQAMAPMTPPGPDSVGPLGSMGWQRERNEQMGMLRQAGGLAQLDAMMRAQQAGEWQEDGPLRANARMLRDRLLKDETDNIDGTLEARRRQRELSASKDRTEMMKQELKRLEHFVEMWSAMESFPERNMLFQQLQGQDEKFGNKRFKDMRFEEADMLMNGLRHANDQLRKEGLEREKIKGKTDVASINAEAAERRNAARMAHAEAMKRLGITDAASRKSAFERINDKVLASGVESLTDDEHLLWEQIGAIKGRAAEVRGATAPAQVEIRDGKPVSSRPTIPPAPSLRNGKPPSPPTSTPPPPAAIAALKANPALKDQFDAKYGKGAAAKILGK